MPILNVAKLLVLPNPYHVLDHRGMPAGAVRLDPDPQISAGQRLYIGAEPSSKVLETRTRAEVAAGLAPTVEERSFVFTSTPVEIDDTTYHRARLKHGELLPADASTHKRVLGGKVPFVAPAAALAKARLAAIAAWKAEHEDENPAFVAAESTPTPN